MEQVHESTLHTAACVPIVSSVVQGIDGSEGGDRAVSFACPSGERYVFVCDVRGHGEPARRPASFLMEATRMLVCQGMSPALVMHTLDVGLRHYYGRDGTFASAFLATIREESVTYVSAGHPDALLFPDARRHAHAAATGPLLGLFERPDHRERTLGMPRGSTLVIATDGIFDAPTADGNRLSDCGLAKAVTSTLGRGHGDLATSIVDAVRSRIAYFTDDYALLTVRT